MSKLAIAPGTTSNTVYVFVKDSSSSVGAGLTGLAYNTSGISAYYVRPRAAATPITLATQTATGAFSSGGFVAADGTNTPGLYRLDLPDAAVATGVRSVVVMLKGAANMTPVLVEIDLSNDANVVQWAGSAVLTPIINGVPIVSTHLLKYRGTAQNGDDNTVTLPSGASAVNCCSGDLIFIESGAGAGQSNVVIAFDSSTKIATVANTWPVTNPNNTSVVQVWAEGGLAPLDASTLATQETVENISTQQLPATLSSLGLMQSDIGGVTGDALTGDGTSGSPWGPA